MSLVFFGSDEFSLAALNACLESPHPVALVVTTPPQKKGRGLVLSPSPVEIFARSKNIPVIAPPDLKDSAVLEQIKQLDPELFVVSSYGKYIPSAYLSVPKIAPLNIHPSLVPRYRGSGPIQWALLNGDTETGVSIIEVAKKLDGGDIFAQVRIPIDPREDHLSLEKKLSDLSRQMLRSMLKNIDKEPLQRCVQKESEAVYARKLTREDGLLRFDESAEVLDRKVRALKPWPGTYVMIEGGRLGILETDVEPAGEAAAPGTLVKIESDRSLCVATESGRLKLRQVQPEGKKPMSGADYANGRRLKPGHVFHS
ncbi:MAG TPA: methionyl-tRNA formyltransferase [Verrucomicrobiae bacterium]|jgi:methionyl-tRNA formyltransferase|nr:methionyl-tRNA formyltransferase [Verrucomicrobiae bacterium]